VRAEEDSAARRRLSAIRAWPTLVQIPAGFSPQACGSRTQVLHGSWDQGWFGHPV